MSHERVSRGGSDSPGRLTATPPRCLIGGMTDVTSKVLHEKTGQVLDRARQGERFRILREGRPEAFLIPASQEIDPEWGEIMAGAWEAQKEGGAKRPKPNFEGGKTRKDA